MKKVILAMWACGAAVCSGQLYFEAGPWARGGMDLEVAGGSSAAAAGVQAASPGWRGGTAWVAPLPAGDDGTAQILRNFDDGYVGPSGWAWANASFAACSSNISAPRPSRWPRRAACCWPSN